MEGRCTIHRVKFPYIELYRSRLELLQDSQLCHRSGGVYPRSAIVIPDAAFGGGVREPDALIRRLRIISL